jgi:hypothetical protein
MDETRDTEKIELSEVMMAMDVVDTLRHQQSVLERELQSEDREAELVAKLRRIYADQGLEVTDEIISQGVRALREDRFAYQPTPKGLQRRLANLYINRGKWAKRIAVVLLAWIAIWAGYRFFVVMPEERRGKQLTQLTQTIETLRSDVLQAAVEAEAVKQINAIADDGLTAVRGGDLEAAEVAHNALQGAHAAINQTYTIQIVSRPGMPSGVWRYPEANRNARNYYLIVEALSSGGQRLKLPITSEEDGSVKKVSEWGLRVDEQVFEQVKRDKAADGIVDKKIVGKKQRGHLTPTYAIDTTGAAITQW